MLSLHYIADNTLSPWYYLIDLINVNEQKTVVINKLLAICDNEILHIDIPGDSSFEDLPFECQLQYMCFVKCAGLFSSMGESDQAVNSYLRVIHAYHDSL